MTQEEKSKAYDEALERAKSFQQKFGGDYAGYIFPELAESEDERIKKAIVHLLEVASEAYLIEATGFKKEQFLSYLEKQKEQNMLPGFDELTPDEDMSHPLYLKGFDAGRKVQTVFDEQKPAEWSEEDKRKLNRIYEILGYAADDKGFLTSKRIIGDKEAIELQDFLKSLRPSWKHSEEQMKEETR